MSRTIQLTYDAHDPRRLGLFWRAALDYAVDPPPGGQIGDPEETLAAWIAFLRSVGVPEEQHNSAFALVDPAGHGSADLLPAGARGQGGQEPAAHGRAGGPGLSGEDRMAALERECDRLVALGATRRGDTSPTAACTPATS